jgi:hypothetical protein
VNNDMSSYKGKRRPGYEKLMAAVESDEIAVVAWHPIVHTARLRSWTGSSTSSQARRVAVQTVTADLSTAPGRAIARTVGACARAVSER